MSGRKQIEYGPLTDPEGRPVAIRVFAGSTADSAAFIQAVEVVRGKFSLRELFMVGDRGMITAARIRALKLARRLGIAQGMNAGVPAPGVVWQRYLNPMRTC